LNGNLSYSSADGFFADNLLGVLWEHPISVDISASAGNDPLTQIKVIGTLPGQELSQLLNLPSLDWIRGTSAFDLALSLGQDRANFSIQSSLEGISIDSILI
jgi:hypothetical protein